MGGNTYDNFPYHVGHMQKLLSYISRMLAVSTTLNVDIASFCLLDRIEAKVSCFISTWLLLPKLDK